MMKRKKLFRLLRDSSAMNLQERLYRVLLLFGLFGFAMAVLLGAVSGKSVINVIPLVVFLAFFCGVAYFSLHYHKVQMGAVILSIVIIYMALPFNFLTSGGIYGGAPIWIVFGFSFVCFVVEGKLKYILLGGGYVLVFVCYYIAYCYPSDIVQHTLELAYVDGVAALTIVSLMICGMIIFQSKIYQSENEMVKKQRKEIKDLNQAQNRFFSSMSHEIRTPLNTIIGLNEMIQREAVSDEVMANAKNIHSASKMLLALINDILDMSKIESGKMDIVPVAYNVGDMLSDIVNMIWVRAKEKEIEFHIDVSGSIPAQLYGDEVRIKQILINLLNNAVKYTQEGSVVLSIQSRETGDGRVEISYSVSDTGMGIKKESIPYLFRAFKRVDEEQNRYIEGTGLGLSIVKQLVDLMGGSISVNSIYRKGSTFVVTLPQEIVGETKLDKLDLEKRYTLEAREHYKTIFEAPKAHILIVDDNETNLMVAEKLLQSTKVTVDLAGSAEECLHKTDKNRYNVIFMDHLMPEMDGIECLHEIRTQRGGLNQETDVVVLTANAGSENQELYRREGFDGYLLKPVTGIQLETELLKHLPKELVRLTDDTKFNETVVNPVYRHKMKLPVLITTDSVCDLPRRLIEKYPIAVMPYRVHTSEGIFMDGIEIETEGALSYIAKQEGDIESQPPEVEDYERFFAAQLTRAQHIIHIAMAKKVSNGYENSLKASQTFDNITVLNSGHLSSGMGLMVLEAASYAAEGLSANAIVKEVQRMPERARSSFIVGSTEYLARAGRIAPKINTICEAFMIHPVIVLKDSSMKVGSIRFGSKKSVWRKYIRSALKSSMKIDKETLFITHAGLSKGDLDSIAEQVKKKVQFQNVIYQKASPAISTNCGPDTFGLLFMMKNEKGEET